MINDAKEAAADGAGAANDAAAFLAGGAAIAAGVAVFTGGVGAGVAAVLALGSAAAWWVGNEYGDLAADPPRYDYHLVARFRPRNVELPRAESQREAIWNEFNQTQIEIADAIATLITSFERLAGARLDLRKPGNDADLLARSISTQRQAIRQNAAAAKQRIQGLIKLRSRVNIAWHADTEAIRASDFTISSDKRQQAAAILWSDIMPTLRSAFGARSFGANERLGKIQQFIEQAAQTYIDVPDEVLNSRWTEAMLNMERRLAVLAGERTLTPLRHELERRA